nr:MAG TPA: hypothetical protein [Caudoviricetes sp.]
MLTHIHYCGTLCMCTNVHIILAIKVHERERGGQHYDVIRI